jgi:hypothetical protein
LLFVDKLAYDHDRWHLFGFICTYLPQYRKIGKEATIKAIESGVNVEGNTNILKFYEEEEKKEKKKKKTKKKK